MNAYCPSCQKLVVIQKDEERGICFCQDCKGPVVPLAPTIGRQRGVVLIQAAVAAILAALFCLGLIVAQGFTGQTFLRPGQSISRWALYVCVLMAFWALTSLFMKWLRMRRRARCITDSKMAMLAAGTEDRVREFTNVLWASAQRHHDDYLAERVQRLLEDAIGSGSAESSSGLLTMATESAYAELEADYAPVRIFLYTIPILGFIGTLIGVRDAVGNTAATAFTSAQQLDSIKAALAKITISAAGSFNATIVALLLSVLVMVTLSYVIEREKSLLQAVDDYCRMRVLPFLLSRSRPANTDSLARVVEILIEIAGGLRAGPFDTMRGELTNATAEHIKLVQRQVEQSELLNSALMQQFKEVKQLLADRLESEPKPLVQWNPRTITDWPGGQDRSNSAGSSPLPVVDGSGRFEEIVPALDDLREGIRQMEPSLRRLAENLRRRADKDKEPVVVKLKLLSPTEVRK